MFKNWFSRSTGERLKSRSRPANQSKPHTSSHSRSPPVPTHHNASQSYNQRRSSTTTTSKSTTTKKPHASIVVRKDGNIEVVTPRATVVVPKDISNVVSSRSQPQHRTSTKTTSHAAVARSGHTDSEGSRESTRYPKLPQSTRSDGLPTHVASRPSTTRPRRASYSGYSRDHDYAISSSKAPPPAIQVVPTNKFPRRGSYPLSHLPGTYVQEPSPIHPEVIYQPVYPQPSPVLPHALYPTPAPRVRRSLSNTDSMSSYYSDYSGPMQNTYSVPRGWYNRRGDQYMRKGVVIMQPPERQWHPVFASYPDVGKGWMDEDGNFLAQSGGILKGGNGISVPSNIHIR